MGNKTLATIASILLTAGSLAVPGLSSAQSSPNPEFSIEYNYSNFAWTQEKKSITISPEGEFNLVFSDLKHGNRGEVLGTCEGKLDPGQVADLSEFVVNQKDFFDMPNDLTKEGVYDAADEDITVRYGDRSYKVRGNGIANRDFREIVGALQLYQNNFCQSSSPSTPSPDTVPDDSASDDGTDDGSASSSIATIVYEDGTKGPTVDLSTLPIINYENKYKESILDGTEIAGASPEKAGGIPSDAYESDFLTYYTKNPLGEAVMTISSSGELKMNGQMLGVVPGGAMTRLRQTVVEREHFFELDVNLGEDCPGISLYESIEVRIDDRYHKSCGYCIQDRHFREIHNSITVISTPFMVTGLKEMFDQIKLE